MTREPENESVRITVESLILTVTEQVSDESRPLDTKENVNTQTIDDEIVSKTRRVGLPPEKEYKSARRLFSRSDSEVKANIRDIIKFKEDFQKTKPFKDKTFERKNYMKLLLTTAALLLIFFLVRAFSLFKQG
ncbi:uncharacterized protein LOC143460460 [Clavelina lepadiformis]|uniref:uncharacterized protein LOC143460460 n=1 Tax=Clavelina lepadiformis TaxID=159417 RepID=UPI004041FC36